MPVANTIRVGIIGGGFAGLSAARYLISHNLGDGTIFDVTLLEARDRLGGRAYTNYDCGAPVDLGCSWIHGVTENPIYTLAQNYNLPLSGDTMVNRAFFDSTTGEKIDDSHVTHALNIFNKIHNASKFFGTNTDDFSIPLESTLFTYLNNYRPELYEGLPVRPPPQNTEGSLSANSQPTNLQSTNSQTTNSQSTNSQPTNSQSTNSQSTNSQPTNSQPTNIQSPNSQSQTTNSSEHTADQIDDVTNEENKKNRGIREGVVMGLMMVEQLITAARLNEISVMGWSKYKEFQGPQVMFREGYSSLVNALAATVFDPISPAAKLLLSTPVTSINYENHEKITITTKQGDSYEFDHVIVTVPLGVLKAKQLSFVPPLLPFKQQAINSLGFGSLEKIALRFKTRFWDHTLIGVLPTTEFGNEFLSFVSLHDVINEPVLLVFIHGQFAKILQRMDKGRVQELVMKRLREIFPNCTEEPTHFVMSKWFEDIYSRGSYSFPAVGGGFRDIVNLTEPIQTRFGVPRVMFAGEATDPVYYGTTHAAFMSGEREGKRLVDGLTNSQRQNIV